MTPDDRSLLQDMGSILWDDLVGIGLDCFIHVKKPSHRGVSSTSTKITLGVIIINFLAATIVILPAILNALYDFGVLAHHIVNLSMDDTFATLNESTSRAVVIIGTLARFFLPIVNDALIIWRAWVLFTGRTWAKGHLKLLRNLKLDRNEFRVWQVVMLLADTGAVYCILQLNVTNVVTNVYFMLSAFYPALVMYLVDECSSAGGIHEVATRVYESPGMA
ncbi:hypothetical protein H0H92_010622 [Tricholoma furcatifolium]|nr:hypothetical protein H0H92_010622 [Tricholoma furcatifolium]